MASARTVQGLRNVAARLKARGFRVEFVPGWESRGAGSMVPKRHVEHHTATGAGWTWGSVLQLLTQGRSDLRNALCTWAVPHDGHAAYLVCAGTAWHAGSGGWKGVSGNTNASGTESQNTGGQPWPAKTLALQAAITAEMAKEFGFGASNVCEHKEWAPSRKPDRYAISGADWRNRVAADMAGKGGTGSGDTSVSTSTEEDWVVTPNSPKSEIADLQYDLDRYAKTLGWSDYPALGSKGWDGDWGPKTKAAVEYANLKVFGHKRDGNYAGPALQRRLAAMYADASARGYVRGYTYDRQAVKNGDVAVLNRAEGWFHTRDRRMDGIEEQVRAGVVAGGGVPPTDEQVAAAVDRVLSQYRLTRG